MFHKHWLLMESASFGSLEQERNVSIPFNLNHLRKTTCYFYKIFIGDKGGKIKIHLN